MKKSLIAWLIYGGSLCAGSLQPVWAQSEANLIDASNPAAVLEVARGFGSAELKLRKEGGAPVISGRAEGIRYTLNFYGCEEGKGCKNLGFSSAWKKVDENPVSLEAINAFNAYKRWGKGYLDDEGDPVLNMDVEIEHGVTRKNLGLVFEKWAYVMKYYQDQVVWKAEKN
jgi:hypothetical protein